jgi:Asp-tRNA(Asn)/Glu-tRNA(Gln) amidotransferase A subunit family amidase
VPARTFQCHEADAIAIVRGIEAGSTTSEHVIRTCLDRIRAFDKAGPAINAVITVNDTVLEDARACDSAFRQGSSRGPLHGVPVIVKDNFDVAGMATTGGCIALKNHRPPDDSFVVGKLRSAGAIVLGKANLHELALGGTTTSSLGGQTRNPYELSRTPGGSSGGTAAAVTANYCPLGMGSDTVNSIRSPASAQNVVGLRPTRGLLSRGGVIPVSPAQDAVGPITRSVRDAALMLDVMVGCDARDPTSALGAEHGARGYFAHLDPGILKGLRIGICTCLFGQGSEHAEVNRVVWQAIATMERAGARLTEMSELDLDVPMLVGELDVQKYEFRDAFEAYLSQTPAPHTWSLDAILETGMFSSGIASFLREANAFDASMEPDYRARRAGIDELRSRLMKTMADKDVDVLVYPLQRQLVAPIDRNGQPERNGIVAALTGFPAIDVPAGFSSATASAPLGVPIGMDLLARPWCEQLLLDAALAFEQHSNLRVAPLSTPVL